jgi:branched-chain amino acid transport system substrate-binding protein
MRPVVKPLLAVAVALAGGTAAVLNDDQSPARATAADATSPDDTAAPGSEPASGSDGILTIGVLLPRSGEGATIGIPATSAVDLAVNQINQSGGVFGENVRLVPTDEGNTMEQAAAAVDELIASDVDAVVGPASSLVALEYLDEFVDAGVLTCSPSATALALDDFPDDGLFFRTVPSDSLSAVALGFLAGQTGVSTATVVYVDDAFGRPFARAVMDNLPRRQIDVLDEVPLTPGDTDYSDEVELLAGADATGTIVVIAASNAGWSFLSELAAVMPDPPDIVVNDALRRPPAIEIVAELPEDFRSAIVGFSPLAILGPDAEPAGAYAPQAFNCVNAIALAAVAAGSDVPGDIADHIQSVTGIGRACAQFEECIALQSRGLDVDYEGPANLLRELGDNGDPDRAVFEAFRFGADGIDIAGEIGSVSE